MAKITIYHNPSCATCKQVYKILKDAGVDFTAVDYYVDLLPKWKLSELLKKMNMTPRQLLRTNEEAYKFLRLNDKFASDDEILDLMVEYPDLIQRPIVEKGSKAIIARPAQKIKEIL